MPDRNDIELAQLKARIATLEQLVEVYERSVIEQSDKLYAEQERMRFQKILLECQGEASLDGILSISVDGTILFANARLSQMWGVRPPVIGSKSHQQVFEALAQCTADPAGFLERAAELEHAEEGRGQVPLGDGRTFDEYTAPIRSQEGDHLGRVWHFRDISAFKEIDRLKDDFVSAVSHELRTPLTSIQGSLGLMSGGVLGELPSEAKPVLEVAQRNCDRLVRLINDVLDIGKIEAGRIDLHLDVLDLEPLLRQSLDAIRLYGDQLGVGFQLEVSAPGVRAKVDPDRLIQVMDNLLSNAAKFSPPGETVTVAMSCHGRWVRVSVSDRGPGIAPDFQSRLFDKFAQGAPKGPRQKGGTGLGLNIARAIVERLGGTIGFRSRPGTGTTFHFDLPEWRPGDPR